MIDWNQDVNESKKLPNQMLWLAWRVLRPSRKTKEYVWTNNTGEGWYDPSEECWKHVIVGINGSLDTQAVNMYAWAIKEDAPNYVEVKVKKAKVRKVRTARNVS